MEYNDFGTDEFMSLCRLTGAQPMICMNLGSGTKEEARKWVEYVNGAPTTPEGARRAANGHRDPYPPTIWELGNELWGDDQVGWQTPTSNAARYLEFYPVVRKQALPGAILVSCGPGADFTPAWNGALIKQAGKDLSYLSVHYVVRLNQTRRQAPRCRHTDGDCCGHPGRDDEPVEANPGADRRGPGHQRPGGDSLHGVELGGGSRHRDRPVWVGPTIGGAVIGAGWMNMLLSHADFVPISSMSGLMGGIRKSQAPWSGPVRKPGRSGFTRIAPGTRWWPPKPRFATMTFTTG